MKIQRVLVKVNEEDNSNNFIVRFNIAGVIVTLFDPNNSLNVIGNDGEKLN